MTESTDAIKKLTEEQDANRAILANLQATIAQLEDKLNTKQQVPESVKAPDPAKEPRTLAIFSGWTFRSGKVGINDVALSTVENFIGDILSTKGSRVLIEGHTDNIPTGNPRFDNLDLSLRRAKAISNILVSRGISSDRISIIGYGDARPIDSNDTEDGRARNRRVEVKLIPKEGTN
ncbi:MAG: OmpA family protein [Gammaproteobacteria bacterium]